MIYIQQEPIIELTNIIKYFWLIDSENDATIHRDKIIPDGYPEIIFHYKKPYKSTISGSWSLQDQSLIAGQIKNHFYLENTGETGMFAIKFQPWALKVMFGLDMSHIVDAVIGIDKKLLITINPVKQIAISETNFKDKVTAIENWFISNFDLMNNTVSKGQEAIQLIIKKKGEIAIQEVLDEIGISERSLERYFKTHIGLTPKFYSRIIRFSNIFSLVQKENFNWSDVTYLAGFYDQSHFIKNFREFSGEEPSKYGFSEENMANFFLKK